MVDSDRPSVHSSSGCFHVPSSQYALICVCDRHAYRGSHARTNAGSPMELNLMLAAVDFAISQARMLGKYVRNVECPHKYIVQLTQLPIRSVIFHIPLLRCTVYRTIDREVGNLGKHNVTWATRAITTSL